MLKLFSDYETCFKCVKAFHSKKKSRFELSKLDVTIVFYPTIDYILFIYFGICLTVFEKHIDKTNVHLIKKCRPFNQFLFL